MPPAAGAATALDLASVERGKRLFLETLDCVHCHPLDAAPGGDLLAPSLLQIGRHGRADLEESILRPGARVVAGYETWQVSRGGIPSSGRRLPSPPGTAKLVTRDDRGGIDVRVFTEEELEPAEDGGPLVAQSSGSAMPAYAQALARDDLDALLDFLWTLR